MHTTSTNWKRPFFAMWSGQAISLIGSALVQFALIWWMTETTQSATVLATASLMSVVPEVVLAPFGGVLVDRWKRRLIMIFSDALVALATHFLALLFWMDIVEVWHIYLTLFLRSISSFQGLAMRASTSLMVPESRLSRVAGYNQTLFNVIRIGTPPLGALLVGLLPLQAILMIDVTTAFLGITPLFFVSIPQPVRRVHPESGPTPSVWSDLKAGLRYVTAWRGLLYVILMMSFVFLLFEPARSLLPILVIRHFEGGPMHLAWLNSAFSIGGLASGILLSLWAVRRKALTSFLGVAGVGIGCLVLGLAPSSAFWLAVGGIVIIAVMMGISDGPMGALLQARVAPEMQGRVFTVMGSLMSILIPLGLVAAGWLADAIHVQLWFILAGVMCILVGLIATRLPAVMQLETRPVETQDP